MIIVQTITPGRQVPLSGDPPFMDYLRREYPAHAASLFCYRHSGSSNFVVAGWVNRDRGRFIDLLVVGRSPGEFSRAHAAEIRVKLRPTDKEILDPDRLDRELAAADRAEARQDQDNLEEWGDLRRHIYRQYIHDGGPQWGDVR